MLGNCGQVPALSELIFQPGYPWENSITYHQVLSQAGLPNILQGPLVGGSAQKAGQKTALLGWNFSALAVGFRSQWQSQIGS